MNTFAHNTLNLYKNHPILFIYGLGDYVKEVFHNKNLKFLVIFEDDKNILKKFTQETYIICLLKEKKLFLFDVEKFDFNKAKELFLQQNFMFYSKIAKILKFKNSTSIQTIQNNINEAIKSILNGLQSSQECEIYIKHFCENLPKTLTHSSIKDFLNTHKAKSKNAIIVASGPSLIKQLPLLKQIQNKVAIFCADGSYTILHQHNIKPDYVFCIERDFINGKEEKFTGSWIFFDNDFGNFDDNILFILSDTVHPKIIKLIEKNNRNYMVALSANSFSTSFEFDDFGYCDLSFNSVANLAYNFAVSLKYENIILIGQDLAFGKDGKSHPKEFLHGSNLDFSRYKPIKTTSYGGKGEVYTHTAWLLYKEKYEYDIAQNKNFIKTYNATEGGARIEGSIEKSFKELCENIIDKESIKNFQKLSLPDKKDIRKNLTKSLKHFNAINQKAIEFLNQAQDLLVKVQNISLMLNNLPTHLSLEKSLNTINFNQITNLKQELKSYKENILSSKYFSTILLSYMYANECNFIELECIDINEAKKEKINELCYVINHERHISEIANLIKTQYFIINKTIANIQILVSKDFHE
ncbi:motility associated factor glycosyltransferase family protein [Campylobacter lari]|uniref:motility associated factor glycosyltransferase family protein n=1 Tax=Campylobacter lari TaxID=201 RepID=UPI00069A2B82|nr:6-hydroxymethylpterin diphosphokinase MptE-like protein [Campylobacter lari]